MYTTSFAFFEAIWEAGVTHCFVNLGSDHPSIMEAIVKGQRERPNQFPRIITCPNEMVALSIADGFARVTNKPQCVIIHVDVGTSGLGAAVHNAYAGRAPVLIFAGLSPYTIENEYRGTRTEYIHWLQDVPDQKQIVAQYCRYVAEIKRGKNVKQIVNRALSFATSNPQGPVYVMGSREAMEEEIEPYSVNQAFWTPNQLGTLGAHQLGFVAKTLVEAETPLLITGYTGRAHEGVNALLDLSNAVRGLRVLDAAGSEMCFPASHAAWQGLRYGEDDSIRDADVIIILECDVPWITSRCRPKKDATIVHIDSDPLKSSMPIFYIDAVARFQADPIRSIQDLTAFINTNYGKLLASDSFDVRWQRLVEEHRKRIASIALEAQPTSDGRITPAYLISQLRAICPKDTTWVVEAVTNSVVASDQIQATIPGSWINCGGGGLGWSGGGALGVKLATMAKADKTSFVCQIVGDGAYMFSVPSSVYWIAQRYNIPALTVVLNNHGWNAPRKSLLLVHPNGEGSRASNAELHISFDPTPDYSGIAKAASCHKAWGGQALAVQELSEKLTEAVEAVIGGRSAILDAHVSTPSKF